MLFMPVWPTQPHLLTWWKIVCHSTAACDKASYQPLSYQAACHGPRFFWVFLLSFLTPCHQGTVRVSSSPQSSPVQHHSPAVHHVWLLLSYLRPWRSLILCWIVLLTMVFLCLLSDCVFINPCESPPALPCLQVSGFSSSLSQVSGFVFSFSRWGLSLYFSVPHLPLVL